MPQIALLFDRIRCGGVFAVLCLLLSALGCDRKAPQTAALAPVARNEPRRSLAAAPVSGRREALPPAVVPVFVDVASELGVVFQYYNDARPGRFFLPEVMGGGVGWLDYDNDGHLDLMAMNGCLWPERSESPETMVCRLFRNRAGGGFTDVSFPARAACLSFGMGCAMADYNADGFADIYLTNYGPNILLCNLGDGTFCDVTQASGTGDSGWSTGAAWFDADRDGDEDLYVVNYLDVTLENSRVCKYQGVAGYCGPGSFEAVPDRLFVNAGDGRFEESAAALGLVGADGKGMGIAVLDLDDDLLPEVFVANDMAANYLFTTGSRDRPAGDPSPLRYFDVAITAGCALSGAGQVEAGMGIGCADFDGDGHVDLFLTHYFSQKNTLYRNLGGLHFHDDSFGSRVAAISKMFLGFGTVPLDYDRDGASDLFVANGHVLGPNMSPNEMQPQLLRNDGRGRFDDISSLAGSYFADARLGRGVAQADFDNDGDSDLAVNSLDRPLNLLRNETVTGRHHLGIQLLTPNRVAPVGGRVAVTIGGKSLVQPVVSGGSYLAASDTRLVFALGAAETADQVQIFWPSGRVDRFDELPGDRYWIVMEGQSPCLLP